MRPAPRPDVPAGLPVTAYDDARLDRMAAWILSDGVPRDERQLEEALCAELGLTRGGMPVAPAVTAAARRARA